MKLETLAFILLIGGALGHMGLRCLRNIISLVLTGKWHSHMTLPGFGFLNNRGEVNTDAEVTFDEKQQAAVDKIVQERIARERSKFSDYEQLKTFKTEYEKSQEVKNQEELVRQRKYEEAENGYKTKINEFGQKLIAKDQEIQDLRISHALNNEVSKQNGYTEEVIALIKGQTVLDTGGHVLIKSKDANGLDVQVPLSDGVKKFLTERPHLVRSTHKAGAGTGAGGNGTGAGDGAGGTTETLESLNAQLLQANKGTDLKLRSELKQKIKTAMAAKGHR